MTVYESLTDLIGKTPLLELKHFEKEVDAGATMKMFRATRGIP